MLNTRPVIRATNQLALASGLTHSVAYRWLADGFIQRAFFTAPDAREHVEWCRDLPDCVRPLYCRNLTSGRFVSVRRYQ